MNKSVIIPLVSFTSTAALGLQGCDSTSNETQTKDQQVHVQKHVVPVWAGSYMGNTPCMDCSALCEDCEGMSVKLSLHENMTYTLDRVSNSGNDSSVLLHGKMQFKAGDQTQLELLSVQSRNLLFVHTAEHTLEILQNETAKHYAAADHFILERS
ncbi:copper resistance protein NlpE N-terminal domain-containing protein [Acinetobacter tianfuensis]|uniref:Copper resistance protein NlpE n=1 Tax=Acinetobacter tianfuensis TaxID=2419603 RepID=A0A3A8E9Z5_9GAMM|nr:copper resistance protein NlpE N-terminal domain-containing protein [Acinetobacter tianfuensis]RKG30938.1 hypothetical protein D7V32_09770 [Acinetobacter tianfuensis]